MPTQTRDDHHKQDEGFDDKRVRTEGGQFQKGKSGNPRGRPRKVKVPAPTTLSGEIIEMLRDLVPVTIAGKKTRVSRARALALRMIAQAVSAPLTEQIRVLLTLDRLGLLTAAKDAEQYLHRLREENSSPAWTAEIEERYRLIEGEYDNITENLPCGHCGKLSEWQLQDDTAVK